MFYFQDETFLMFGGRNETCDHVACREFINFKARVYDKDKLLPQKNVTGCFYSFEIYGP